MNKDATKEILKEAERIRDEKFPDCPFYPVLKVKSLFWVSRGTIKGEDILTVLKICAKLKRYVLIQTGGHGDQDGGNPCDFEKGDLDFAIEDIQNAAKTNGVNVSIRILD